MLIALPQRPRDYARGIPLQVNRCADLSHAQSYERLSSLLTSALSFLALIASKYSESSFLEFVRETIFTPRKGVDVTVGAIECAPFQPPSSCEECRRLRMESGLDSQVRVLTWAKLHKPEDIVSLVCVDNLYIICISWHYSLGHGGRNPMTARSASACSS